MCCCCLSIPPPGLTNLSYLQADVNRSGDLSQLPDSLRELRIGTNTAEWDSYGLDEDYEAAYQATGMPP